MSDKAKDVVDALSKWVNCEKCSLHKTRREIVFGDGDPTSDIVIIGSGPSVEDDEEGIPFLGEWGEVLDAQLEHVKMSREEFFLMNLVACRPFTKSVDFKTGREIIEEREPTPLERSSCRPQWEEVIYLIDPLIIVAMGKTAIQEVTGMRSITMQTVVGRLARCVIPGRTTGVVYPVMPMYHPKELLKTGDTFQGGPWHRAQVAWVKTVQVLDQLRYYYFGKAVPDRDFKDGDLV